VEAIEALVAAIAPAAVQPGDVRGIRIWCVDGLAIR
jgi:hypothetical protein